MTTMLASFADMDKPSHVEDGIPPHATVNDSPMSGLRTNWDSKSQRANLQRLTSRDAPEAVTEQKLGSSSILESTTIEPDCTSSRKVFTSHSPPRPMLPHHVNPSQGLQSTFDREYRKYMPSFDAVGLPTTLPVGAPEGRKVGTVAYFPGLAGSTDDSSVTEQGRLGWSGGKPRMARDSVTDIWMNPLASRTPSQERPSLASIWSYGAPTTPPSCALGFQPLLHHEDKSPRGEGYKSDRSRTTSLASRPPSLTSTVSGVNSAALSSADELSVHYAHMALHDASSDVMSRESVVSTLNNTLTSSNFQQSYFQRSVPSRPWLPVSHHSFGTSRDVRPASGFSRDAPMPSKSFNAHDTSYGNPMSRATRPLNFNSPEFRPGMSFGEIAPDQNAYSGPFWKEEDFADALLPRALGQLRYDSDFAFDTHAQPAPISSIRSSNVASHTFQPSAHDIQHGPDLFPSASLLEQNNSTDAVPSCSAPQVSKQGLHGQSSLLSHFRATMKTQRHELRDIYGHVVEFSSDQHGSRFIQTRLETANSEERERVFGEIRPYLIPLMTDVFGNYVIQKFFEYGSLSHKDILAATMQGQVASLSRQPYGCRVVQKALDHVSPSQQAALVNELDGAVIDLIQDQNGNHVIQKVIERCLAPMVDFVVRAMRGQVHRLSIHSYGCRVVQRCLEKPALSSKSLIFSELTDCIQTMIPDQYGNYVVQYIVTHEDTECKRRIMAHVIDNLEILSRHKYASNVVEKCVQNSDGAYQSSIVHALSNIAKRRSESESLVGMVKDQYGNYVIQTLLDTLCESEYRALVNLLRPAIAQAKRTNPNNKQIPAIESKMTHGVEYAEQRFPPWNNQRFAAGSYGNMSYSAVANARI